MLLCRIVGYKPFIFTAFKEDIKAGYDGVGGWVNDPRQSHPSLSYGSARPLYIKLHNENDNNYNDKAFPKLHLNTRRQTEAQSKLNQTWPVPKNGTSPNRLGSRRLAILEPLENQYDYYSSSSTGYSSNSYYSNNDVVSAPPHVSINPSSLPPLVHNYDWRSTYRQPPTDEAYQQYDNQKGLTYEDYRQNRWTRRQEPDLAIRQRLAAERENGVLQQKPILARQNKYGSPVVSSGSPQPKSSSPSSTTQTQHKVSSTSPSPCLSPKPVSSPSSRRSPSSPSRGEDVRDDASSVTVLSITSLPDNNVPKNEVQEIEVEVKEEEKQTLAEDNQQQLWLENEKLQQSSAPREGLEGLVERQPDEDHIEVKSISEHEEEALTPKNEQRRTEVQMDTLSVEEERLPTPPPPLAVNELLIEELKHNEAEHKAEAEQDTPETKKKSPCKILGKPRTRLKRSTVRDHKVDNNSSLYPLSLQPFDNAKETLNKCLLQLDNPDWEITMQGLQGVVRLSRHHTGTLLTSVHPVCVAVTKHIRSLRSQVSRAACQAAAELFASLGRAMEPDIDDIAGALLNRSADTNKFLRADCNTALDVMVNTISPVRSVSVICNKGAKHQNAVVRTAACRLLVKLCERLGAERTLNMPRDCRDSVLTTGARFLTEGSLDTRRYAKEMFAILSRDNRLPTMLHEVVPGSVMRSISKVLSKLATK